MPYMTNGHRDYQKEKQWDHKTGTRLKARASRNKARALMKKKLGSKAIAGKDIGHKKAISKGGTTTLANLFVQSPKANRSFARKADGSMKSERSRKGR